MWDTADRQPSEITGFLSKVARNGLASALKEAGRRVEAWVEGGDSLEIGATGEVSATSTSDRPDLLVERREFASALRRCAQLLAPRTRLVWFFRVFCEMPSREIAAHPDVRLKASHVDVLLQRSRVTVRNCMRRRGFEPVDMPPDAFFELWKMFADAGTLAVRGATG